MYNVLIRPLREEDAVVSFKWRNDPEIWEFTGSRPDRLITIDIELAWIRKAINEKDSYRFAIIANDNYVGNIQITNIKGEETGEYHIFIGDKSYWGKGIATLATYQIIRFSKERLKLNHIYLFVKPENKQALRMYEKCGFSKVTDEIRMLLKLTDPIVPKVSVFMMAYNHELYIRQAIESVLMQKTNFDFDIVIGEDSSTDKTRSIILKLADEYPGKFKLLLHEKNIGANANQEAVLSACTGKYIAMCEGDDYWIDPLKLQKQVDFLDANTEYGLVCTDFLKYNQKENKYLESGITLLSDLTYEDLINWKNQVWSLTVCFRKILLKNIPELDESIYFKGDCLLFLNIVLQAKIKIFPEKTAVYRVLEKSASHFDEKIKSITFTYKVANLMLLYWENYPISNQGLYKTVYNSYMLARFKYSRATGEYTVYKKVRLNFPVRLSVKSISLYMLFLLCKCKPFFVVYSSIYRDIISK